MAGVYTDSRAVHARRPDCKTSDQPAPSDVQAYSGGQALWNQGRSPGGVAIQPQILELDILFQRNLVEGTIASGVKG